MRHKNSLKTLIFAFLILFTCSCSQLRYTDYGRPLDFLKVKKVSRLTSLKVESQESQTNFALNENKKQYFSTVDQPSKRKMQSDDSIYSDNSIIALNPFNHQMTNPFKNNLQSLNVNFFKTSLSNSFSEENKVVDYFHDDTDNIILAVLCVFFPPIAVFLLYGISNEFWIDLLLTVCFLLPGIIYAFYLCFF